MSNKTELQSNNIDLQGILDSINALPEAGSGASIETCTVNITTGLDMNFICWSSLNNGAITPNYQTGISANSTSTLQNVIKNSAITISYNDMGTSIASGGSNTTIVFKGVVGRSGASGAYLLQLVVAKCTGNDTISISSGTTCCFIAGTQVLMTLDGQTKNIEDVRVGDKVVSYDINTKENYITEVGRVIVHENTIDIAEVTFDSGMVLTMNAYHPLYCENGFKSITRYANYDELVVGDVVKTVNGWSAITNINRYNSEPIVTYNIDVKDIGENPDVNTNDTYYANGIVVKNPIC